MRIPAPAPSPAARSDPLATARPADARRVDARLASARARVAHGPATLEPATLAPVALALVALVPLALALTACPGPDDPPVPPAWRALADLEGDGWRMNVWASGPDDVWVAGGSPERGELRHFDGTRWQTRDTGVAVPLLNWTFGFSAADVFVVGNRGTILRWDGAAFAVEDSGTTEDLWGIWGSAPDDVWAVGGSGFPGATATLLHRDAAGWSAVTLPPLSRANVRALFKVWGSGPRDVWVVGQRGAVLHFDGERWAERPSGVAEDLIAVWGAGPDRVAIVGGRGNGVLLLWDGAAFRAVDVNYAPGLNGVWMGSRDVVHVTGVRGTLRSYAWDGALLREDDRSTTLDFHAIHGVAPRGGAGAGTEAAMLFAVGGSLASVSAPFRGLASVRALAAGE